VASLERKRRIADKVTEKEVNKAASSLKHPTRQRMTAKVGEESGVIPY
jgi:hypothetical protein